jgi:hypothetical protein
MSQLVFRIRYPDGREESLALDADRATIGSGAHCEIRLPVDAAKVEHVSVQLAPGGVYAQALAFDPPALVNGMPFTQGTLSPESTLVVGGVEIVVEATSAGPTAATVRGGQQKTSPMTMVLVALLIPLAAFVLLMDDDETGAITPPKQVPELWAAATATCPQTDKAQALAFAVERNAIAEAKRERSPFDVRDGVAAVPLFEAAAACFKVAGEARGEADARAAAAQLKKRFSEEYRTHTVWLEHVLKVKDWKASQREVSVLLAFTDGKKGEYVTWLGDVDRQLRVKFGQRTP